MLTSPCLSVCLSLSVYVPLFLSGGSDVFSSFFAFRAVSPFVCFSFSFCFCLCLRQPSRWQSLFSLRIQSSLNICRPGTQTPQTRPASLHVPVPPAVLPRLSLSPSSLLKMWGARPHKYKSLHACPLPVYVRARACWACLAVCTDRCICANQTRQNVSPVDIYRGE